VQFAHERIVTVGSERVPVTETIARNLSARYQQDTATHVITGLLSFMGAAAA